MSVAGGWWPEQRSGELVAYLDEAEHARLLAAMEPAEAEAGDFILHKGSPSRSLLVVEDGEVEVLDESMGDVVILARVGPGSVVGEVGFLDGRPRTHDVRAVTPCRLRRLTRDGLLSLVKGDPALFAKLTIALAELLARRFRSALAELEPVRAFAASLHEPEDLTGDGEADGGDGPGTFDEIDEPLPEQALELLRAMARSAPKNLAGV
jgi:CRP-like cAMP-binding protein